MGGRAWQAREPTLTLTPTPTLTHPMQVKRARAKQLSPDEYTTGTFTISNLGMFGVESFDAILPPGERRSAAPVDCMHAAAAAAAAAAAGVRPEARLAGVQRACRS